MLLKINNFSFSIIDFYPKFLNVDFFIHQNDSFKNIQDFEKNFNLTESYSLKLFNQNNEQTNIWEGMNFSQVNMIKDNQTGSDCHFYIRFSKPNPFLTAEKNTANIDYLAMMLDIDLEEEV